MLVLDQGRLSTQTRRSRLLEADAQSNGIRATNMAMAANRMIVRSSAVTSAQR
jgi:hypothetical protein